jgi:hypothetical protein
MSRYIAALAALLMALANITFYTASSTIRTCQRIKWYVYTYLRILIYLFTHFLVRSLAYMPRYGGIYCPIMYVRMYLAWRLIRNFSHLISTILWGKPRDYGILHVTIFNSHSEKVLPRICLYRVLRFHFKARTVSYGH